MESAGRLKRRTTDASEKRARRRRPGGRNAEVRDAVRRATLELLANEGFGAVTLPAVARRAGVNKTTVYRGWASTAALLQDALAELEALALPDIDTGSFDGDVEAFVASRLRLIREPHAAGILRAVIGAGDPDPTLYEWVEAFWKPRQKKWRSPIEHAIERGELAASAREVPLVEIVAGPLLLAQLATRRRVTRRDAQTVAAIVVAGVRALHPPASRRSRSSSQRGPSPVVHLRSTQDTPPQCSRPSTRGATRNGTTRQASRAKAVDQPAAASSTQSR